MVDIEITDKAAELAGEMPVSLSSIESDTIGEILNISMGSAATAVSTLLGLGVSITTPRVSIVKTGDMELKSFEPAIGIEIKYIEGLNGANYLIMKRRDIRAIVNLLIEGSVPEEDNPEEELDDIQLSAISEIMNQMMGASSTALASFFGKSINISPPDQFDPADIKEIIAKGNHSEYVVSVMFLLEVEGVLNSEFVTIMPIDFTKELVANVMSLMDVSDEAPAAAPEAENAMQMPPGNYDTIITAPTPSFMPGPAPAPEPPPIPPLPPMPSSMPSSMPAYSNNSAPLNNSAGPHGQAPAKQEPVRVQKLKLANFDEDEDFEAAEGSQDNFSLILGVPLDVTVEIGKTKLPVKNILEIRQGSIIELDRQAGDPADIIVNGQLIAKGDVVVIDDNFGVRITEIVSQKAITKQLS